MILPERVFGSSGVKTMFAGFAIGPILTATWLRSSSSFSTVAPRPPLCVHNPTVAPPALERHERDDRLAGRRIRARGDRRLGDILVVDERRLDLDRRDAVARHV